MLVRETSNTGGCVASLHIDTGQQATSNNFGVGTESVTVSHIYGTSYTDTISSPILLYSIYISAAWAQ